MNTEQYNQVMVALKHANLRLRQAYDNTVEGKPCDQLDLLYSIDVTAAAIKIGQ